VNFSRRRRRRHHHHHHHHVQGLNLSAHNVLKHQAVNSAQSQKKLQYFLLFAVIGTS
jgi:hypothetical protein